MFSSKAREIDADSFNLSGEGGGGIGGSGSDLGHGSSEKSSISASTDCSSKQGVTTSTSTFKAFGGLPRDQSCSLPRCQVEGCNLDLSSAKDYHRRHRVCELHSKSSKVVVAGLESRFCQQCSRFHSLSEFDEGKRSCRRRLSGHNRRRPQQETIQFNSRKQSSAIYVVEDKPEIIGEDTCPREVQLSLTVEWTAPEVQLIDGRCSELPENPSCPFLVKLFLQHNTYLTEIPASFFDDMPVLRVLDMSNTSIKTLPSSISKLFRLQKLFLRGCEMLMELPPEIGCLTNLKVLDLEGTELVCLPKQVGWLLQLECLKFSLYRYADRHRESINGIERSIISRETLSKLSSLKELSIDVDPECEWWEAEVEAIISDLGKLGNMETLKLYLPTVELLQQFLHRRCVKRLEWVVMPLIYPTLSNFRFIVGRHENHIMSCIPRDLQDEFVKLEKCLKYVNGEGDSYAIINALKHVGALFLHRHWTIERLSVFDTEKMDKLKFCLIAECNEMKTILAAPDFHRKGVKRKNGEPILGSLHYLGIHCMKNLRSIWEGPIVNGCLSGLKILAIHTCPVLSTIFNLGLLNNLIFLQELIVEDCPEVRSLVTLDSSLCKHKHKEHKEFLPRLEKISLLYLPELRNISSGLWIAPKLKKMVVYNCPKLKNLHPLERCSKDIKEIKGESEWWDALESNKSELSSNQHDYLVHVFVPIEEDDDSIDELAKSVQISLTAQLIVNDAITNAAPQQSLKNDESFCSDGLMVRRVLLQ